MGGGKKKKKKNGEGYRGQYITILISNRGPQLSARTINVSLTFVKNIHSFVYVPLISVALCRPVRQTPRGPRKEFTGALLRWR